MSFNIKTKKILSEENCKRIIALGLSLKNGIENIEQDLIKEYDSTKTYSPNMACYYNDYLYRCLFTTTGEFDINSWEKVGDSLELVNKAQVEAMLGLTQEEIETLQKIINDSQITLSTTYSSSKIFSDLQQCLNDSKKFTLEEFAKANKASYHVVSATSEMTDESVIYLMSNNTNYDMYIVESDGTPVKIGDTTIDLSQFYTKTEIDNDFVKKTDADGKYALITTVDNHINDTVAHMTQSEKDSYALKSSITNTINSTSTSTDIASAKGVYENAIKDKNLKTYTDISQLGLTTPITVGEIFSAMPNFSLLRFQVDNYSVTDAPALNGILIIDKIRSAKFSIEFKISADGAVSQNSLYIGQLKGSDASGLTWSRVCTTSVADTSQKVVSLSDETNYKCKASDWIHYEIYNGVCYLRVLVNCVSPSLEYIYLADVPKPVYGKSINCGGWGYDNKGDSVSATITHTGKLGLRNGTTGGLYLGTISYPVA